MTYQSMTLCASHSPGFARDKEEKFGDGFRDGLHHARDLVADFAPTLVVIFGSDHRRAFTDTVPAFSIMWSAEGLGDLLSPTGSYDVPRETAKVLSERLLDDGFDIAVNRHVALDHGFGQTYGDLFGSLGAVPTIPVFINCATLPLAAPARAAELGKEIGTFFSERDERVLYIGSGGLSHNPPTLAMTPDPLPEEERQRISKAHRDAARADIRPEWDEDFIARLGNSDSSWARAFSQDDINPAGVGANEIRTWLAAYAAGSKPLTKVVYEPVSEWITGMGIAVSGFTPKNAAIGTAA